MRDIPMQVIIPAIIPQSLEDLRRHLKKVTPFAKEVQIDIVDGIFVPFTSWPYVPKTTIAGLGAYTKDFIIEIDLMVREPEQVVESYLTQGVQKVVIHLESTERIQEIIALKSKYNFALGVSTPNGTPIEILEPLIPHVDYVQCMGIKDIGTQGQPFDTRVLERATTIHAKYPDILISVDGAVTKDTISHLYTAGVRRMVAGSAIFGPKNFWKRLYTGHNVHRAYRHLEGVYHKQSE